MVLALGMAHSQKAMEAQREVSDMTNELLKKNADKLKMGTIETAKESERGIVDLETLQHTNQRLIETLDEVLKIQNDGRNRRRQAETELGKIEGQLKQKLLEING
ncbi:TelA-like protein [bioreactor metagenome]|uniref:TelA-like protein n=1 Tax=bioreactor metagenome TaxID=1076179 RepID=A0A645IPM0_9ZZZZ